MRATCYCCGAVATSREHVPPKALFPERRDLPAFGDLRKDLRTVPSCSAHNQMYHLDDQYLADVVTCHVRCNELATGQFLTKVVRAVDRRPKLGPTLLRNVRPVRVNGSDTIAFTLDLVRVNRVLDKIARAVFWSVVGRASDSADEAQFYGTSIFMPDLTPSWYENLEAMFKRNDDRKKLRCGDERVFLAEYVEGTRSGLPELFLFTFYEGVKFIGVLKPPIPADEILNMSALRR